MIAGLFSTSQTLKTPKEISWDKNLPFVDPITTLVTEALMSALEKDSKISIQGNSIKVQRYSEYTIQIGESYAPNYLWLVRTLQGINGYASDKENLNIFEPASLMVGEWMYFAKKEILSYESQMEDIKQGSLIIVESIETDMEKLKLNIKFRKKWLKVINQTLELAKMGLDALSETYEDRSQNTCKANRFRKIGIEHIQQNGVKRETTVSPIEQKLQTIWKTAEIKQVNKAIELAKEAKDEATLKTNVEYVVRMIESKNKIFEQHINTYWSEQFEKNSKLRAEDAAF